MSLERFAQQNGDDAVLFGPNKRPFLAATIQTYMRKFVSFIYHLRLAKCRAKKNRHFSCVLSLLKLKKCRS